jgi:hypothetical protein
MILLHGTLSRLRSSTESRFAASPMISKLRITASWISRLPHEALALTGHIGLYGGNTVSDVLQIGKIGLHKGCASASM